MATNPPIVIGPFANVPAPGSGVKSDWAQQITNYVLRTVWAAPALAGAWTNYDATNQGPRYRKVGDQVFIEGMVKGGAASSVIFTLPVGFRPPLQHNFAVTSAGVFAIVTVKANGEVTHAVGPLTSLSIECNFSVTA